MSCTACSLMLGSGVTSSCMSGCRRKSDFSLIISTLLRLAGLEVGGRLGVATFVTNTGPLLLVLGAQGCRLDTGIWVPRKLPDIIFRGCSPQIGQR